jgi:drug/metabolite transporter (DMT)-like permease
MTPLRTIALTVVAMLAFAANSLLCRMALQQASIDPASFGSVRLVSGALVLAAIVRLRPGLPESRAPARADWLAAAMLWLYVACFSFAYLSLAAGTGALILFGAVQITMFSVGLRAGERFTAAAWAGLALAVAGLLYLVSPGIAAPAPQGAALMAAAGIAWGIYSLRGRGAGEPVAATAGNFLRAAPLALALSLVFASAFQVSAAGLALAVASGAVTSGLGYVVWYAALPGLSALRAATVQLSVPPLAAVAGVLLLSEALSTRLLLSSAAILGGISLVLFSRTLAAKLRPGA